MLKIKNHVHENRVDDYMVRRVSELRAEILKDTEYLIDYVNKFDASKDAWNGVGTLGTISDRLKEVLDYVK